MERVAGGGHELRLRALASDELHVGAPRAERVSYGERRHDVSRCPSRGDHDRWHFHLRRWRAARVVRPFGSLRAAAGGGHVEEQPHRPHQHHQVARAVRDERQRHAGERHQPEHGEEVQCCLAQDQRRDAGGEQLRVAVAGELRHPQSGVADHAVQAQQPEDAEQPELLADDSQDHVGVRLGQVEDLLHRLAQADPEEPAVADRGERLNGLEARVARVGERVDEREEPLAPVGLGDREDRREEEERARRSGRCSASACRRRSEARRPRSR